MDVQIPSGSTCAADRCWHRTSDKGWVYVDRAGSADGIVKVVLRSGTAGKPKLQLMGRGDDLSVPPPFSPTELFEQDTAVVVQLHRADEGSCWSSTFDVSSTRRNDTQQFKATAP